MVFQDYTQPHAIRGGHANSNASAGPMKEKYSTLSVIKRVLAENAREYAGRYLLAIACLATLSLSTAFTAWIMKWVVNGAFVDRRPDLVWATCIAIFLAFFLRGLANYGQAVILSKISNNISARYQILAYNHLMSCSVEYFNQVRSGQIISRINYSILGIRNIMNIAVTASVRDVLTFLSLIGVMFLQEPLLTLSVFVGSPPLIFGLRYLSKRIRSATRDAVQTGGHIFSAMQETLQGISVVKAFTMEGALEKKVGNLIETAERRNNRIVRISERTAPLIEIFAGLVVASIVAFAAYRSIYYDVPPGGFMSFLTALLLAYDPAKRLARLPTQLQNAVTSAEMIYELLDMEPRQRDKPGAKPLVVTRGQIEFRNVAFSYGNDTVLRDISFVGEGGKATALIGPSGAGKSTIITLIPRFFDPQAGSVLIDGQDIADVTKRSLREQLAYVSQQAYMFAGTIRDNIRYGRPEATDAEVEQAARLAFAHDFILAQPLGYETQVGENGVTLSGGQRQRLSIARALVRDAPILLLDEATSALDSESEAFVQKALDHVMVGRTVIVIAHRLSTIRNADKIIVVQQGRVLQVGNHESLSKDEDGLYARLQKVGKEAV